MKCPRAARGACAPNSLIPLGRQEEKKRKINKTK